MDSSGMKATDILDMAFDMKLERPNIATAGEWDGGRIHILTYGPLGNRKTLEIPAPGDKEQVEALLRAAVEAKGAPEHLPAVASNMAAVNMPMAPVVAAQIKAKRRANAGS